MESFLQGLGALALLIIGITIVLGVIAAFVADHNVTKLTKRVDALEEKENTNATP